MQYEAVRDIFVKLESKVIVILIANPTTLFYKLSLSSRDISLFLNLQN